MVSEFLHLLLVRLNWAILFYFLAVNTFYAILLASATLEARRHRLRTWNQTNTRLLSSNVAPRLSVIAPAHNEGATLAASVRALLTLSYTNLEVVVVNDGSDDETLDVLKATFDLTPIHTIYRREIETQVVRGLYRSKIHAELIVVDKENGGKADALNAGLNVCTGELICAIDADTLIEPDALLRMVGPFLRAADDVVAVGGTIRVANDSVVRAGRVEQARAPRRFLSGVQAIEYLRAFLVGRLGWNRLGGNLIVSGAFGLFDRNAMIDAGGYLYETVGEDMELVVNLRRRGIRNGTPSRVEFVPDPVAWTEVPSSPRVLGRQRDRWHRGLSDVVWRYRGLLFNPKYRALGLIVYPYFLFVELLAPAVEALGIVGVILGLWFDAVNLSFAMLFFLVAYGYGAALSILTLTLDEFTFAAYRKLGDRMQLLLWAILENLGYRQLTVVWRLRGIARYLRRKREWGVMTRRGFTPSPQTQAGQGPSV